MTRFDRKKVATCLLLRRQAATERKKKVAACLLLMRRQARRSQSGHNLRPSYEMCVNQALGNIIVTLSFLTDQSCLTFWMWRSWVVRTPQSYGTRRVPFNATLELPRITSSLDRCGQFSQKSAFGVRCTVIMSMVFEFGGVQPT